MSKLRMYEALRMELIWRVDLCMTPHEFTSDIFKTVRFVYFFQLNVKKNVQQ